MKLSDRLKNVNKKWYLLLILVVLLIVGIGGGIAVRKSIRHHYARARSAEMSMQIFREVCTDLVYLEKFQTLRVTPEQAREMLPLVDQLSAAGPPSQAPLAKQIYGALTPQQYATLLDKPDMLAGGRPWDHEGKRCFLRGGWFFHGDREFEKHKGFSREGYLYEGPKQQALGDVVIKMLKARSTEK